MTYQQTLDYLFSRLPSYQFLGKSAYKPDLSNITALCDALGQPENKIKTIHVAGTNGKGSVCHMLASIFQEAGYKTGLYTSPHLVDFRERVKINGQLISETEVVGFVEDYKTAFEAIQPSFFEWTTALAFHYFAQQKVDVAIIETGLGGRLDSTNIISPELSIITSIGKDHQAILGHTLEEIATEKAGIIKSNTPVIVGEQNASLHAVFINKAKSLSAPIYFADSTPRHTSDLKGVYQNYNIPIVEKAVELLQKPWCIAEEHVKKGLSHVVKNTKLLGRWQVLQESPKIICDVAHNEAGMALVIEQLLKESFEQLHFVMGMSNDKDIHPILTLLPQKARYYFCQAAISRALNVGKLKAAAQQHHLKGDAYSDVKEALSAAKKRAKPKDLIFVGGSIFTVAEVLE